MTEKPIDTVLPVFDYTATGSAPEQGEMFSGLAGILAGAAAGWVFDYFAGAWSHEVAPLLAIFYQLLNRKFRSGFKSGQTPAHLIIFNIGPCSIRFTFSRKSVDGI